MYVNGTNGLTSNLYTSIFKQKKKRNASKIKLTNK